MENCGNKDFYHRKGRCNATNARENEELLDHVAIQQWNFIVFHSFINGQWMEFGIIGFSKWNDGNPYLLFDHSSDVIANTNIFRKENVDIYFNTTVKKTF